MRQTRIAGAVGALFVGAALAAQFYLQQQGMHGAGVLAAAWRFFGYFTILTSTLIALVWLRVALRPEIRQPLLEAAGAVSIVMVGVIYHLLLASRWNPQGLQYVVDIVLHTVSPIMFALYWLSRPHGALRWRDAFICVVWPLGYCAYALVRGAFDGWYAYYFLDPTQTPPLQLALSIAVQSAGFLVCALVFVGADKALAMRAARTA